MEIMIPVTELRTHIADILKRLRENPALVFKITHHKEVVAELKAPEAGDRSADADGFEDEIFSFIQAYRRGEIKPREGAYEEIRKLCATDQPPYPTVEAAMHAIRNRSLP